MEYQIGKIKTINFTMNLSLDISRKSWKNKKIYSNNNFKGNNPKRKFKKRSFNLINLMLRTKGKFSLKEKIFLLQLRKRESPTNN